MWKQYDNGSTIGQPGSENGVTLRDEEHDAGIRISLERDGWQPFSVTCGIYGAMVHTAYAENEEQAEKLYLAMKESIEKIAYIESEESFQKEIERFVEHF